MNNSEITIDKTTAAAIYKDAPDHIKTMLEEKYGKKFFVIEDFIEAFMPEFLEACKITGDDPILPFPIYTTEKHKVSNAHYMLDIFHDLFIKTVVLDWTTRLNKWIGIFNNYTPGSGFRFGFSDNVWTFSYASGGARFALDTKEKSDEFNQKYLPLINIANKPKNQ